ncbi:MAG: hypothetical protein ACRDLD_11070, partial [Thermoleophilaceae bacterium]
TDVGGRRQVVRRTVTLRVLPAIARVGRGRVAALVVFPPEARRDRRTVVTLTRGGARLGRSRAKTAPGRARTVRIPLTRRGRRLAARERLRARLTVVVAGPAGERLASSRRVTLVR